MRLNKITTVVALCVANCLLAPHVLRADGGYNGGSGENGDLEECIEQAREAFLNEWQQTHSKGGTYGDGLCAALEAFHNALLPCICGNGQNGEECENGHVYSNGGTSGDECRESARAAFERALTDCRCESSDFAQCIDEGLEAYARALESCLCGDDDDGYHDDNNNGHGGKGKPGNNNNNNNNNNKPGGGKHRGK